MKDALKNVSELQCKKQENGSTAKDEVEERSDTIEYHITTIFTLLQPISIQCMMKARRRLVSRKQK